MRKIKVTRLEPFCPTVEELHWMGTDLVPVKELTRKEMVNLYPDPSSSVRQKKALRLAVKSEYFHQIRKGEKFEEYRLVTPYWTRRLDRRFYDFVDITLGYPSRGDWDRTMRFTYDGYELKTITHQHFGPDPVRVYAIKLNGGWQ